MTPANTAPALVIGAAGGIGSEVLRLMAAQREVLAVVLDDAQAGHARQNGAAAVVCCDLADKAAVGRALDEIVALLAGRGLSALINCAAIQPIGACEVSPRAQFEQVFAVNFFSSLEFIQALLPALRQAKGRVVLFSSLLGRVASPLVGVYAASKFALEGYADALRREVSGMGISVSLVEPGHVNTPMAAAQPQLAQRAIAQLSAEHSVWYAGMYRGYSKMAQGAEKHSTDPATVARVAAQAALAAQRPKPRYLVGGDAKMMVLLSWLLPSRGIDWLFGKLLKQ